MDDLHHWSEAVGGAGSSRQQVMALRLVEMIVDPYHYVQGVLLDRRRDDDLPDAPLEIRLEELRGTEPARALKDDLHAELAPRHVAGLGGAAVAKLDPVDREHIAIAVHVLRPAPM